jgi:hypothetical protein
MVLAICQFGTVAVKLLTFHSQSFTVSSRFRFIISMGHNAESELIRIRSAFGFVLCFGLDYGRQILIFLTDGQELRKKHFLSSKFIIFIH